MTSDPLLAWIISLAICTAYGWWMHRRGIVKGSQTTANYIVKSIIDSGKMSEKQIASACQKYWDKIQNQDSDIDGES